MFSKRKQPPIRGLIAQGSRIDGNIRFVDGLRVDGEVKGAVMAEEGRPSILVISESGVVEGSVLADHVIISGRVTGPVHARALLELQPKARIAGEVHYHALEMHEGALIDGLLHPLGAADAKPLLTLAANNPGR